MLTSSYVVLSGVSEGDRLITSGIQKIGDGVPVQDAQASPPGGRGGDAGGGSGGGR
jgi:hypothetical protein